MRPYTETPETQNWRLEPTGLATPSKTNGSTGKGPGLACKDALGQVFGWFSNRTNLFLRSAPRVLAGYVDPLLTLSLSAKDLPGSQTEILNICLIWSINHHPVESDEHATRETILDTTNWLHWTGDLDNSNDSEDNCAAENESDIEKINGIGHLECSEQRDVRVAPNVPRLVGPVWKSMKQAEKGVGDSQCNWNEEE